MLTQLLTVKARLGIAGADTTHDATLTALIESVSARFDRECRRTLARTVDTTQEFRADECMLILACYPLEEVSQWELKSNEAEGWLPETPEFLIRRNSILNLPEPLGNIYQLGRVTYTGGYVLPGTTPQPGQFALPKDLEGAATDQVVAWFQNREKLGLIRHWPNAGTYLVLSQAPLLTSVQAVLRRHERWAC